MPYAKELQSIVDYTRAPDAQEPSQVGPAIDPMFEITDDDSFFWPETGEGSFQGIRFLAAMLTLDLTVLLDGLQGPALWKFGFEP